MLPTKLSPLGKKMDFPILTKSCTFELTSTLTVLVPPPFKRRTDTYLFCEGSKCSHPKCILRWLFSLLLLLHVAPDPVPVLSSAFFFLGFPLPLRRSSNFLFFSSLFSPFNFYFTNPCKESRSPLLKTPSSLNWLSVAVITAEKSI